MKRLTAALTGVLAFTDVNSSPTASGNSLAVLQAA